jgi:hypothetical protein
VLNAHDEEDRRIARVLHEESGPLVAAVYDTLDEIAKAARRSGSVKQRGAACLGIQSQGSPFQEKI